MFVEEAINRRRSIRRFSQKAIGKQKLKRLLEAARLAPSSGNKQPLAYLVADEDETLREVFSTLTWAKFLDDRGAPPPGKRPTAYVIVLVDSTISTEGFKHDVGLAVENILLLAVELGLGSCCLGSVDRERLRKLLSIPPRFNIDLVVALGYPAEKSVVEKMGGSIRYWKDEDDVVHVPKRRLEDVVHWNRIH
jgi:nitroreductase